MVYAWFCTKCGHRLSTSASPDEDFQYYACRFCHCKMRRCIKKQVFSPIEKFIAWWLGEKLVAKEVMSITEAAHDKRFHKEYPNAR